MSGFTCQRWDTDHPHTVDNAYKNNPHRLPELSLTGAENYCRQPDDIKYTPWCYSTNENEEWEYCFANDCEGKINSLNR